METREKTAKRETHRGVPAPPGEFDPICTCEFLYEALDGTSTCFLRHLRRGREGHWRHAGSLTTAVPAALVLPRSGSSVDVDILVRQYITNAHASKLCLQECRNLPVGYACTRGRAEHVEALYFAIGQPTVTPLRARGATEAPKIHTPVVASSRQPCSVMCLSWWATGA